MSIVEGVRRGAEAPPAARRDLYRFLASVFLGPPGEALLRRIVDARSLAQLGSLLGDRAVEVLGRFARTVRVKEDLGSLRQEYMDLFMVPTGHYVTPFEDVYRGTTNDGGTQERGPLLGHRAIAVKLAYRAVGAELDRTCTELPTHVGVELLFMAFLCDREAEETGFSNWYQARQASFLEEHLNDWFPQLSEAIRTHATSLFYPGLAVLTEEFLAWDSACLSGECQPWKEKQDQSGSVSAQAE